MPRPGPAAVGVPSSWRGGVLGAALAVLPFLTPAQVFAVETVSAEQLTGGSAYGFYYDDSGHKYAYQQFEPKYPSPTISKVLLKLQVPSSSFCLSPTEKMDVKIYSNTSDDQINEERAYALDFNYCAYDNIIGKFDWVPVPLKTANATPFETNQKYWVKVYYKGYQKTINDPGLLWEHAPSDVKPTWIAKGGNDSANDFVFQVIAGCNEEWVCLDGKTKQYRDANCNYSNITPCGQGESCSGGVCGSTCTDNDGDGYCYENGADCDDWNLNVHANISCPYYPLDGCGDHNLCVQYCPSPPSETCNGMDDDCDGVSDARSISCGPDGAGQHKQVCSGGDWVNSGSCSVVCTSMGRMREHQRTDL
ncbi:MAG: hypothetical protein HYV03_05330 [Deltaproteobacteria bacterium]|nr:hypothetical protein [Deltaproteobacteria bacterium]